MKVHFIGIGGIGVSALAKYYLDKGDIVSGSDVTQSSITDDLIEKGAEVLIGEQKKKTLKTLI
jgi:UDP-N-acetylmuramate--alanine ligase